METRANHILIGAFTLGVVLAAMGFVLWLSKSTAHGSYYDVKFVGSVSGLPEAGEVRYNGFKVGTVEKISIVPMMVAEPVFSKTHQARAIR